MSAPPQIMPSFLLFCVLDSSGPVTFASRSGVGVYSCILVWLATVFLCWTGGKGCRSLLIGIGSQFFGSS